MIKQDPRDLLTQFRRLAPERRPIPIQRWSVRRVALAAGLVVSFVVAVGGTVYLLTPDQDFEIPFRPDCTAQTVTVLMAQAVPTATAVPCIEALPTGLSFASAIARNGEARFWLDSDRAGARAVTVTLTGSCDTSSARPVSTDEVGTERFDSDPAGSGASGPDRFYRLPGGCVTYDYSVPARGDPELIAAADGALGFLPRDDLVAYVDEQAGQSLCGAGTTCPGTP
jgi:hypothetical protein